MMPTLLWIVPAIALLACGWFASAWYYKRKIELVQHKLKAVRQTAAAHADQARRQIGQLQIELAARGPAPRAAREAPPAAAAAAANADATAASPLLEDGFAATTIGPTGFLPTQIMEDKRRTPG